MKNKNYNMYEYLKTKKCKLPKIIKVLTLGIKIFGNFDLLLIQHPKLQKYFDMLDHKTIQGIYKDAYK